MLRPQEAPIVQEEVLPPVPPTQLLPRAIAERFSHSPVWTPETSGDGSIFKDRTVREAAVLIPLIQRAEGLTVLLTQRTAHLHDHGGQISFPGGRRDPEDESLTQTALRETTEEIGIASHYIKVLGALANYQTVTAYRVTPFVALVEDGFVLKPDPFEVEDTFEVPLVFFMDPRNHQRRIIPTPLGERSFFAMPFDDAGKERFVWGATAAMLRNFYRFLTA
ncbi:MAG: CoA pyrophosphatase [Burkholderiaceae bacterium]|nr:CoA pyrophosphatase [Burkholderiaceae bacterium]